MCPLIDVKKFRFTTKAPGCRDTSPAQVILQTEYLLNDLRTIVRVHGDVTSETDSSTVLTSARFGHGFVVPLAWGIHLRGAEPATQESANDRIAINQAKGRVK